ncbi:hypothetical protein Q644_09075 [Brucella intermedia 229E]|uniref:Uncharacterized protein n=1 Tax=Brucella intermedia 229E TaxID=1337887 RepID=U4VAP2_9HYPH|nr:hypothetical protein Q644_09075 [Brucella intermedia 229E]
MREALMLSLRQMLDIAIGEVRSMDDLLRKGGRMSKPPRPDMWIAQHERIRQHRLQVVKLIEAEIDRRKAEGEAA